MKAFARGAEVNAEIASFRADDSLVPAAYAFITVQSRCAGASCTLLLGSETAHCVWRRHELRRPCNQQSRFRFMPYAVQTLDAPGRLLRPSLGFSCWRVGHDVSEEPPQPPTIRVSTRQKPPVRALAAST